MLALTLGGCAPRAELALMAVCLGVDADESGVTLTVKAPSYAGDKEEAKGYAVLSGQGTDWTRAVKALFDSSPAAPQFGQLREIVIGRAALDVLPPETLLGLIDRLPSLRAHALVTVCAGRAADAVAALQPELGKRLSKYLDLSMAHSEQQGIVPAASLSASLRDLGGPWRDPVLAYRDGGECGGFALGTAQRVTLTAREVQLFRLLRGEKQDYLLAGRCGVSPRGPARRVLADEELRLELPVFISYSLYDAPPGPEAAEQLRSDAEALLRKLQDAGCDALGFGCEAARNYATLDEFLRSGWAERFRTLPLRVQVDALNRQDTQ